MVTISAGYTYSDTSGDPNNEVNASNLHTLVDGAVISSIQKSEFLGTTKVIDVSGSQPSSPSDGDMWYDTSLSIFRLRRYSEYDSPGVGFEGQNEIGYTIPRGAVCVVRGGIRHIEPCMTGLLEEVCGVTSASVLDGSDVFVWSHGIAAVLVTGGASPGDLLSSSVFTGKAIVTHALTSTHDARPGQEIGIALATLVGSGLVTAMIFR